MPRTVNVFPTGSASPHAEHSPAERAMPMARTQSHGAGVVQQHRSRLWHPWVRYPIVALTWVALAIAFISCARLAMVVFWSV